jgi:hypothetical protein
MPSQSPLDYDHHGIGDGNCLVLITFFGLDKIRNSSPFELTAKGDDRVVFVASYACSESRQTIR